MQVMIDLCVIPLGVGVSVSEYVTACQRVSAGSRTGAPDARLRYQRGRRVGRGVCGGETLS